MSTFLHALETTFFCTNVSAIYSANNVALHSTLLLSKYATHCTALKHPFLQANISAIPTTISCSYNPAIVLAFVSTNQSALLSAFPTAHDTTQSPAFTDTDFSTYTDPNFLSHI
jgi:hypothetical protein